MEKTLVEIICFILLISKLVAVVNQGANKVHNYSCFLYHELALLEPYAKG